MFTWDIPTFYCLDLGGIMFSHFNRYQLHVHMSIMAESAQKEKFVRKIPPCGSTPNTMAGPFGWNYVLPVPLCLPSIATNSTYTSQLWLNQPKRTICNEGSSM